MTTFIGIDWADKKHDICALSPKGDVLAEFIIPDTAEGFEQLQIFLTSQVQVEILIEKPNGLIVEFLLQRGWCVKVISPSVSASHRPRRSKTDRGDAYLLANLLRMNDPDCHLINQDSTLVQELRQIVDAHANLQREKQRLTLQLRYSLKQYYPVIFDIFPKLSTKLTLNFLETYPTPQNAKDASLEGLRCFFKSHAYTYMDRVPHKYEQLQRASIQAEGQNGFVIRTRSMIRILKVLVEEVKALERCVIKHFLQHPDADWWLQFPGLGKLNAARLLSRIGDNRENFKSADHLRAVAGTVPITRHSGKRKQVLFRQQCSHSLRKLMFDFAMKSKSQCQWAEKYFASQLDRGHTKPRAYRALANCWAGIFWKLWQTHDRYDEAIHMTNQRRALTKSA
ncbi:MAG: IS110 family transposase [Chloroflexota bacterium]